MGLDVSALPEVRVIRGYCKECERLVPIAPREKTNDRQHNWYPLPHWLASELCPGVKRPI